MENGRGLPRVGQNLFKLMAAVTGTSYNRFLETAGGACGVWCLRQYDCFGERRSRLQDRLVGVRIPQVRED
jgi:hypothetical protein